MIALYTDECVRGPIVQGLRRRGYDVLAAVEDGREGAADPAVLDRAGELGRLLYSEDEDLLAEASSRQARGLEFAGVVYANPFDVPIGIAVADLEIVLTLGEPEELASMVTYLPLKGLRHE